MADAVPLPPAAAVERKQVFNTTRHIRAIKVILILACILVVLFAANMGFEWEQLIDNPPPPPPPYMVLPTNRYQVATTNPHPSVTPHPPDLGRPFFFASGQPYFGSVKAGNCYFISMKTISRRNIYQHAFGVSWDLAEVRFWMTYEPPQEQVDPGLCADFCHENVRQ